MAHAKPKRKKEPLVVRSHTVTAAMEETLRRLAQEASDFTGWRISTSAVVRALVRYVERQPSLWAREQLFPLIENELSSGVKWGGKK
jgi:hypothetical protein